MDDMIDFEQLRNADPSLIAEFFVVSPFLVNPTRATFVAKNPKGMLHIHQTLRCPGHLSKGSIKMVLDAAVDEGADVIKEMLEATDARGENCLMIALSVQYSFLVIAVFLEYCKKYADMDKILHQRNSDGLTALSIITTTSPTYFTLRRLSRLVSYFPTQKSFDKALATRDKNKRTVLESCSDPACSQFLEKTDCWKECCDFRLRFVDDAYDDVWAIREIVSAHTEALSAAFLTLENDDLCRKTLSMCVDPYGFNMLQEACVVDAPSESVKVILDNAVEVGILQSLLRETSTFGVGNFLRLCCHLPSLRFASFRLLLHYCHKYANLPELLQESDPEAGRTCVALAINGGGFTQKKLELLVSYFPSNRMFRKVLKQTDIDFFKTGKAKEIWEIVNQPGYWKKSRKATLMNFNYHVLEMRDILQRLVERGKANRKLKKILSSDNTERVKETLTIKDRKGFNLLHSLCCRTLEKQTLKLFLDAAVRVGAIKEVLEAQNDVNGENCLMLASGWFTVESFRLLAESYEKHTDIKAVFQQKNDRGYDSISLVALRGENSLEFVKICLAQLPSDEVCREVVDKRPLKLDLVLPVETKEFLEEAKKRDDCCWQECRDVWFKMKDDDELQEEEEEQEEAEEETEEEEEEEEDENTDEEEHDAVESEEEKATDEEEEEEEPSPLKDILDFIASSLRQHTNAEHQVALEAFCDSVNVVKKVRVGSVVEYEEEN